MAAFETTRTVADGASLGGRLTALATGMVATIRSWNDARVTRNALASLSDRELDDIGLSRSDIDAVVSTLR